MPCPSHKRRASTCAACQSEAPPVKPKGKPGRPKGYVPPQKVYASDADRMHAYYERVTKPRRRAARAAKKSED